jgi:hypothetical protein
VNSWWIAEEDGSVSRSSLGLGVTLLRGRREVVMNEQIARVNNNQPQATYSTGCGVWKRCESRPGCALS